MDFRVLIRGLSLCAGVGMLDEGIRAALEFFGCEYRTVAYVEREAFAAAQLVALMEAGCLDEAPIWSDLLTFDGAEWRGSVDCISAGFPCQPHSVAGKRAGLADERWIWPDIARIIFDVRPRIVILENVPGLISTGGLSACLADLAGFGFDAEWSTLSASEAGASHKRERLFIVAHSRCEHGDVQQRAQRISELARGSSQLADTGSAGHEGRELSRARNSVGGGAESTWIS